MSTGASLGKCMITSARRAVAGVLLLVTAGCTLPLQTPEAQTITTPAPTLLEPPSQTVAAIVMANDTETEDAEAFQETAEPRTALVAPAPTYVAITPTMTAAAAAAEYRGPLLLVSSQEELFIFDVGNETYHEFDSLAHRPVAWSADGCSLFFEGRDLALYRTPIRRFEPLEIVDSNWRNPVPSPSRDWLAYDEASASVVHIVRGDGSEDVELTDRYGQDAYLLGWTTDGQEVLVWS